MDTEHLNGVSEQPDDLRKEPTGAGPPPGSSPRRMKQTGPRRPAGICPEPTHSKELARGARSPQVIVAVETVAPSRDFWALSFLRSQSALRAPI